MNRVIIFLVTIVMTALLMACASEKKAETKVEAEATTQTVSTENSSKATCPSCNMVMEKSEMITYVAEGDTVYFCAEGCKKHYLAQQEKKSE
jgi:YHS domain-containing protein